MVIHHDYIILEVCFLRKGTFHSILDCLLTVEDRNHDGGLHLKLLFTEVDILILGNIYHSAYLTEMGSACLFHLYLHLAVGWVHIVELLLTRGTQVVLFFRIQVFVEMKQGSFPTEEQAQVIEACPLIVTLTVCRGILM